MWSFEDGVHRFQHDVFRQRERLFRALADEGQHPHAAFIACADSRVVMTMITDTGPGEIFLIRNAGNAILPYHRGRANGEAASLEYAVEVLGVRDIVVCGHTGCGAIRAVMATEPTGLEQLEAWMEAFQPTATRVAERHPEADGEARLRAAVGENVLVQLEHVRTFPFIRHHLEEHDLELHGWVYELDTGTVLRHDAATGTFVTL